MREYLNDETKAIYDRHYTAALAGTAEAGTAHAIAREKTLFDVLKASAAISNRRLAIEGTIPLHSKYLED